MSVSFPAKVIDYDYYGAYDLKRNVNYKYNELLGREYTFDFPPHHEVVSVCFFSRAIFLLNYVQLPVPTNKNMPKEGHQTSLNTLTAPWRRENMCLLGK